MKYYPHPKKGEFIVTGDKIPGFVYACTYKLAYSHSLVCHPGMSDHKKMLPVCPRAGGLGSILILPTPTVQTLWLNGTMKESLKREHYDGKGQRRIWQISF